MDPAQLRNFDESDFVPSSSLFPVLKTDLADDPRLVLADETYYPRYVLAMRHAARRDFKKQNEAAAKSVKDAVERNQRGAGNNGAVAEDLMIFEARRKNVRVPGDDDAEYLLPMGLLRARPLRSGPTSQTAANNLPARDPKSNAADLPGKEPATAPATTTMATATATELDVEALYRSYGSDSDDDGLPKTEEETLRLEREKRIAERRRQEAQASRLEDERRRSTPMCINFVIECLLRSVRRRQLSRELILYLPFVVYYLTITLITFSGSVDAYFAHAQIASYIGKHPLPALEQWVASSPNWADAALYDVSSNGPSAAAESPTVPLSGYHAATRYLDITNAREWHLWFQAVVVDYLFPDDGRSAPTFDLQGWNFRVGALTARFFNVQSGSCALQTALASGQGVSPTDATTAALAVAQSRLMPSTCYAALPLFHSTTSVPLGLQSAAASTAASVANRSTAYLGPAVEPTLLSYVDCRAACRRVTTGRISDYPCLGYRLSIPWATSRPAALQLADLLRPNSKNNYFNAIDQAATRAIIVTFVTYAPAIDTFFLHKAISEVATGGDFQNTIQSDPFYIFDSSPSAVTLYVFFFIFYIWVTYYVYDFIANAVVSCVEGRFVGWLLSGWNILEFANLSCFFIVLVFTTSWILLGLSESAHGLHLSSQRVDWDDSLEWIAWLSTTIASFNAVNVVLTLLKILKYFELYPSMSIVTRTLSDAAESLVGIVVVLCLFIAGYALAGTLHFGSQLFGFRDISSSYASLLRFLVLDFDYPHLRETNRNVAPFFFWSFMLLGLFVFISCLVGVMMDAFDRQTHAMIPVDMWTTFRKAVVAPLIRTAKEIFYDWEGYRERRRAISESQFGRWTKEETTLNELRTFRVLLVTRAIHAEEANRHRHRHGGADDGEVRSHEQWMKRNHELESNLADESDEMIATRLGNKTVMLVRQEPSNMWRNEGPPGCRITFRDVFQEADPEHSRAIARLDYVGESGLDDMWSDIYDDYVSTKRELEDRRRQTRESTFAAEIAAAVVALLHPTLMGSDTSPVIAAEDHKDAGDAALADDGAADGLNAGDDTTTAALTRGAPNAPSESSALDSNATQAFTLDAVRQLLIPPLGALAKLGHIRSRVEQTQRALRRVTFREAMMVSHEEFPEKLWLRSLPGNRRKSTMRPGSLDAGLAPTPSGTASPVLVRSPQQAGLALRQHPGMAALDPETLARESSTVPPVSTPSAPDVAVPGSTPKPHSTIRRKKVANVIDPTEEGNRAGGTADRGGAAVAPSANVDARPANAPEEPDVRTRLQTFRFGV